MRIICATLAACCIAAPILAQGTPPTSPLPQTPAVAPAGAPAAAPVDSNADQGGPVELRLEGLSLSSNRTTATATTTSPSSPSMIGAEFALRSHNGGGIVLRYASGTTTPTKMSLFDGRVEIGSRTVALELGYLLRSETGAGVTTTTGYARAGFRTAFHFGSSGVVAELEGSYFRDPTQEKSGVTGSGIAGESSVLYTPPKVPFFVQLGFRREAWSFTYTGTPVNPVTAEEWSTVVLGVGFQLGLP